MHVSAEVREVFEPALEHRAVAMVLAHNQPSGDPDPSGEDRRFTDRMARAAFLLDISSLTIWS